MAKRRKIDSRKLNMILKSKGLTKEGVSKEMGFSRTAFGNSIAEGVLNEPFIKMLEAFYDIPFELYEPEEEREIQVIEAPPQEPVKHELVINEESLYKTIYAAVYQAVKEAFK